MPVRVPDREVGAVDDPIRPQPKQQVRHHVGEEPGAIVDEGQGHREGSVDIRASSRNPAEVVQPGQANVVDDEVEVRKQPGRLVDVSDVEPGQVQRLHGRALVEVHVLDAKLQALLIEGKHHWVVRPPPSRLAPPLGRIPFEAAHPEFADLTLHLRHGVGRSRVHASERDDPFGQAIVDGLVALRRHEPLVIEIHQHLGRQDGQVGVALDEHLLQIPLRIGLTELLLIVHRPPGLGGVEPGMEGVEGFDEGVAEAVLGVLGAGVPHPTVCVENKCCIFHLDGLLPRRRYHWDGETGVRIVGCGGEISVKNGSGTPIEAIKDVDKRA